MAKIYIKRSILSTYFSPIITSKEITRVINKKIICFAANSVLSLARAIIPKEINKNMLFIRALGTKSDSLYTAT